PKSKNCYRFLCGKTKNPLSLLQTPVKLGGLGFPNVLMYHKAAVLEAAIKLHAPKNTLQWVDMENEYGTGNSAIHYMWTPKQLRDKSQALLPLTRTTIQVWDQLHRLQATDNKFLKWAPIEALQSISPWLSFKKWSALGITHITNLCSQRDIIPFPDLQTAYNLPPSFIFSYVQLKSIIQERVLLTTQTTDNPNTERLALYDRC
ncbi:Hypothetical predicted protein, partial [Pelobates cultripes]